MADCLEVFQKRKEMGDPICEKFTNHQYFDYEYTGQKMLCPDVEELYVSGDYFHKNFDYIVVQYTGCSGPNCYDKSLIGTQYAEIAFLNSLVDLSERDQDEVIKYNTETKYYL